MPLDIHKTSKFRNPRPFCDLALLPKKNRIDIMIRIGAIRINSILDASFQEGFPGWEADFRSIEKWVWSFIDVKETTEAFREEGTRAVEALENVKVEHYSEEWNIKVNLRNILQRSYTEKQRRAVRKALKGKPKSEETKRKIAESNIKAKWRNNGNTQLTTDKVQKIMELHAQGLSQPQIAEKVGGARSTVGAIIRGERWNHVTGLPRKETKKK